MLLRSVLDSKTVEVGVGKLLDAKRALGSEQVQLEQKRSEHEHAHRMELARNQRVLGLAVIFLIGVLVVAMVICVAKGILDESTVQKLAIVVLALFSATAVRAKS